MDTLSVVILGDGGRQRHPVVVGDLNRKDEVSRLSSFLSGWTANYNVRSVSDISIVVEQRVKAKLDISQIFSRTYMELTV